jgi:hypothetical protein
MLVQMDKGAKLQAGVQRIIASALAKHLRKEKLSGSFQACELSPLKPACTHSQ